jgi:hypothetical protein
VDSLFEELVGVDSGKTLQFFHSNLRETLDSGSLATAVRDDELSYVASVLAHYAQTSRSDTISFPALANLAEVFDNFILQTTAHLDSEMLEMGGSQVLLFAGFFRDQMVRRHNVRWYDQVGQALYERAGQCSRNAKKRELFDRLSESFPVWTLTCRDLSRTLRENRLLLRLN